MSYLHPLHVLSSIRLGRQVELDLGLLVLDLLLAAGQQLLQVRELLPQIPVGARHLHGPAVGILQGSPQL